jgi:hypothetical protein
MSPIAKRTTTEYPGTDTEPHHSSVTRMNYLLIG